MLIKSEILSFVESIVSFFPGRPGNFFRKRYWKNRFKECGRHLRLAVGVRITGVESIAIGNNCGLDRFSQLSAHNGGRLILCDRINISQNVQVNASEDGRIYIGNDVAIGPNVVIRASNHCFLSSDIPIVQQGHSAGQITIEDDVWIGANAVILCNVVIKKGSIVGAGSVVTKDVLESSVVAGNPAKLIRYRNNHVKG